MTVLNLYGGPLKRDIIQLAFEECGQAGYEFELTPEEYDSALRRMNSMLAMWRRQYGVDLGYNFPDYGHGSADDESGIPDDAVDCVSKKLAQSIAPTIGKAMSSEARMTLATSWAALRSTYQAIPMREMGRQVMRGQGNRYWNGPLPYFVAPVSPDEPGQ